MYLFRGVDEQEEERERARGDGGAIGGQRGDALEQLVQRWRARIAMSARATGLAKRFHRLERVVTFEAFDHPAQRGGEPPNILMQGDVFGTNGCVTRPRVRRRRVGVKSGGRGRPRCHVAKLPARVRVGDVANSIVAGAALAVKIEE